MKNLFNENIETNGEKMMIRDLFNKLATRCKNFGGIVYDFDGSLLFTNHHFTGRILKLYVKVGEYFYNEASFPYHIIFWNDSPEYREHPDGFILVDRALEQVAASSGNAIDLCIIAFIAPSKAPKTASEEVTVISSKIRFHGKQLAAASVQDNMVYKLWKMEAKMLQNKVEYPVAYPRQAERNDKL